MPNRYSAGDGPAFTIFQRSTKASKEHPSTDRRTFADTTTAMTRRHLFILLGILTTIPSSWAQAVTGHGFRSHTIQDPTLGRIDYHLVDEHLDKELPLLVFLDGSGAKPILSIQQDAEGTWRTFSSIPLAQREVAERYHVLMVSKPGIPLIDTVRTDGPSPPPERYTALLSASWRAEAASRAITDALERYPVDRRRIGVMGFSEGGQVAPRVAALDPRVTHIMAFVGGALNQFFDPIIAQRLEAAKGTISEQEAQAGIDSLFLAYERIYADPDATDKTFWGHSHKRWASFTDPPTVDYLVALDIPIYMAQGSVDRNTQALGADYVRLEFIRRRKKNLTFRTYPGCDHFFQCQSLNEAGEPTTTWRLNEAWNDAFAWFDRTPARSSAAPDQR